MRQDILFVVYVDDCLIFWKDNATIDKLIKELEEDFVLTDEGEASAFLGIDVETTSDGFTLS